MEKAREFQWGPSSIIAWFTTFLCVKWPMFETFKQFEELHGNNDNAESTGTKWNSLTSSVQALLPVPNCIQICWVSLETKYARDKHEISLCVYYMRFVQTGNNIHKYNKINYFWHSVTIRNIQLVLCYFRSRDSATGYGLDDRGVVVRVPVGSRIFSSPRWPDRLWSPPSLLFNG
jgi:hypothetical protein